MILAKQLYIYTARCEKSCNAKYHLQENSTFLQLVVKKDQSFANFQQYICICVYTTNTNQNHIFQKISVKKILYFSNQSTIKRKKVVVIFKHIST